MVITLKYSLIEITSTILLSINNRKNIKKLNPKAYFILKILKKLSVILLSSILSFTAVKDENKPNIKIWKLNKKYRIDDEIISKFIKLI